MEEVRAVLRSCRPPGGGAQMSDAEVEAAVREMDADQSGAVDLDEFCRWWERQDPSAKEQLQLLEELNFDEL